MERSFVNCHLTSWNFNFYFFLTEEWVCKMIMQLFLFFSIYFCCFYFLLFTCFYFVISTFRWFGSKSVDLQYLVFGFYWFFCSQLISHFYKPLQHFFITRYYSFSQTHCHSFDGVLFPFPFSSYSILCSHNLAWVQIVDYSLRMNSWRRMAGSGGQLCR